MHIYSRTGATAISAEPEPITPDENGAFEVPEELGLQLIDFHTSDGQLFESGAQRNDRLAAEEEARRNSPAALNDLLREFLTKVSEPEKKPAAKRAPKAAE